MKKIHLVGIGGSGMFPLAQILLSHGYYITGSDVYESDTLNSVRKLNIPVHVGHKKDNIGMADLVVYSAAIKNDNPELIAAREKYISTVERSHILGTLTQKYQNCIAVSGTHGKTTATAMLTQILLQCGFDPTAMIGGYFPLINGNSRVGCSETIICEACEYVDTFLQLHPNISVILNIDEDHLDYFKNLKNIQASFKKFTLQTKKLIIANGDDNNISEVLHGINIPILTFGLNPGNSYCAEQDQITGRISVSFKGEKIAKFRLNVPGKHNIYNALAAIAASHSMGASAEQISESISKFMGVHRRFEILGKVKGITVADDFAHHPTELQATISTAMEMNYREVWAVFQPHTYSRTYMLMNDFAKALSLADRVVLSEILAVREENTYNVFAKDLAEKINGCVWFETFEQIAHYVTQNAKSGDLILTMGGGNIYECARMIFKKLNATMQ